MIKAYQSFETCANWIRLMIRIAEQLVEFMKVPAVKVCAKAGIGRKQSIKSRVIVKIFYKITSKTKILDSSR